MRALASIATRHLVQTLAAVAGLCALTTAPAHAYFYFLIPNGGVVAEQIFPTGTALGLDYQYNVLNLNALPAKQFSINVGGCGAGCNLKFATPAQNFSLIAGVPFLTAESNFPAWSFAEQDNCVGNACTTYRATWTSSFLFTDLPSGFWTQFNLFSNSPPTFGGAVLDPPAVDFSITLDNGTILDIPVGFDPNDPANNTLCGGVSQPVCPPAGQMPIFSTADPQIAGQAFPLFEVPEPASLPLLLAGLSLAALTWRLRPRQRRLA